MTEAEKAALRQWIKDGTVTEEYIREVLGDISKSVTVPPPSKKQVMTNTEINAALAKKAGEERCGYFGANCRENSCGNGRDKCGLCDNGWHDRFDKNAPRKWMTALLNAITFEQFERFTEILYAIREKTDDRDTCATEQNIYEAYLRAVGEWKEGEKRDRAIEELPDYLKENL